jgi:hypothetical protein
MSKNYVVCCIVVKGKGCKENHNARNTSHGTVHTKIATNHNAHNTSHGTVHTKIATKQVPRFRIVAEYFRCCKFRCT